VGTSLLGMERYTLRQRLAATAGRASSRVKSRRLCCCLVWGAGGEVGWTGGGGGGGNGYGSISLDQITPRSKGSRSPHYIYHVRYCTHAMTLILALTCSLMCPSSRA
jgi:hypothetical protein